LTVAWQLRAAAAALILPPAIRLMSFARLMTWLTPLPKRKNVVVLDDKALARWVSRILFRLPQPWHLSCLNRSVVLYRLLRAAGRPVELCIGVTRSAGLGGVAHIGSGEPHIAAHAWLELDGAPYLESDAHFVTSLPVVARFPDAKSLAPTT
jgi:hypothetical protein